MAKRRMKFEVHTTEIDMTPMIDVVFQLLIFFMLTNHMAQVERAQLQLPSADQAKEDKGVGGNCMIVNIHKDGQLEMSGRPVSWDIMKESLLNEAKLRKDPKNPNNVLLSVIIRADVDTPYAVVQKVMYNCAEYNISNVAFGARVINEE